MVNSACRITPRWTALLTGALLFAAGCASENEVRPPAVIAGAVTLDGEPLSSGSVQFTSPRTGESAFANLDGNGQYRVEFPAADVGATYDVTVGPEVNDNEDATAMLENNQAPAESPVPAKYRDRATSGLTFTLTADGENTFDIPLSSN